MNRQPENLQAGDILYENKFQQIRMINGNYPFTHMKNNGVVVLPFDEKGNIYILHKDRPNIGLYYELPRGGLEEGEEYIDGALRELEEETGLKSLNTIDLGEIQPDTGLLKHKIKLIGVKVESKSDLVFKHHDQVDDCDNIVAQLEIDDLFLLINEGEIVDGYTMSAITKYLAYNRKDVEIKHGN